MEKAIIFAGGCFWGVEAYFKLIEGVTHTEVGYIDGNTAEPTYEQVCSGSGHAEATKVVYDTKTIHFKTLLKHFFNIIDPTAINKQGNDIGQQYRTGIYNYDKEQKQIIDAFIEEVKGDYAKPLQLTFKTDLPFYVAEDYHQNYLDKNPNGYCHVNLGSVSTIKE